MTIRPHRTPALLHRLRGPLSAGLIALMALCGYPDRGNALTEPEAARPADPQELSAPQAPLHLSRILIRYLSDGEKVVITRRWTIRFTPLAKTTIVTGTPISVQVEVPPYLKDLGALEQRRDSSGPFPITLDGTGHVISQSTDADNDMALSATMRARALLTRVKNGEHTNSESFDFLLGVEKAAGTPQSAIPPNMFEPNPTPVSETATFLLDDGRQGNFTKNCQKIPAGRGSYPYDYACDITTQLGDVTAKTQEIWRFEEPGV